MTVQDILDQLQTLNPSSEITAEVITEDGEPFDDCEIEKVIAVPRPSIRVHMG